WPEANYRLDRRSIGVLPDPTGESSNVVVPKSIPKISMNVAKKSLWELSTFSDGNFRGCVVEKENVSVVRMMVKEGRGFIGGKKLFPEKKSYQRKSLSREIPCRRKPLTEKALAGEEDFVDCHKETSEW
ncbi:hypothetical protein HAX54_012672, partial [Datura stramonium]|nr:hypothetical protein [Datura stramonium]